MTAPNSPKQAFNTASVRKFLRLGLLSATLLAAGGIGYNIWDSRDKGEPIESVPQTVMVTAEHQQMRLQEWRENWRDVCYFPGQQEPQSTAHRAIRDVLQELQREQLLGAGLVKTLGDMGTAICVDNAPGSKMTYYNDSWNSIFIRRGQSGSHLLMQVVHEARRVQQKEQGMLGRIKLTDTHQRLRMDFALEADVAATTTLVAWRMQQSGRGDLWNLLRSSPLYNDLPTVFTRAILDGKDEKAATLDVFERWYTRETRMHEAYQERKHATFMAGVDRRDIPSYEYVPQGFFNRLGELPDGSNYGANKSPTIRR